MSAESILKMYPFFQLSREVHNSYDMNLYFLGLASALDIRSLTFVMITVWCNIALCDVIPALLLWSLILIHQPYFCYGYYMVAWPPLLVDTIIYLECLLYRPKVVQLPYLSRKWDCTTLRLIRWIPHPYFYDGYCGSDVVPVPFKDVIFRKSVFHLNSA